MRSGLYHEGEVEKDARRAMADAVRRVCGLELTDEQAAALVRAYRAALGEAGASGEPAAGAADGIIGESRAILELLRKLDKLARAPAAVLVLGENGTGKELVARAVHRRSPRASGPFVTQNCSAMPETLLDSALFGHVRGAFTGAVADRKGLFEAADGGTLFLDEVGEMSAALQTKLLRVLEDATLVPVGSVEPRKVDVRVVTATNRDLGELVRQRRFREDLLHRLSVLTVEIPPLRERPEDIVLLVEHFRRQLAERDGRDRRFSQECLQRLSAYSWPGNVRELRHEVERLWVFSGDEGEIGPEQLSAAIASSSPVATTRQKTGMHASVEALERQQIAEALRKTKGNRTHAATVLGVSRRNLIRKIAKMGLGRK
jgi:two-component system response regulator HupR/HoxA